MRKRWYMVRGACPGVDLLSKLSKLTLLTAGLQKFIRLYWQMLLIWLFAIMLGYGSFTYSDYLSAKEMDTRTREINSKNLDVARLLGQSVNKTLTQADGILLFMKTAIESHGMVDPAHLELLKTFRNKGAINQIAVAGAKGDVLFSAVPLASPLNIADREHFMTHTKVDTGQLFIASPRITVATATEAIFLSRRLNDASGNFAGVVTVGLDPDYFADEFRLLDIGPDRSIVLLRTDGAFLARVPALESPAQRSYFRTHYAFRFINQGMTSRAYESPGVEDLPRFGAFRVLPDYPAVVMVAFPKTIALHDVVVRHEGYRSESTAFSLFLILISLGICWLIQKQRQTKLALSEEQEKTVQYLSQMEKQKVEVELARLDRLNVIGELAASIGHEVRNPLTTVRGYLQLFQRKQEYGPHNTQFTLMIEELDRANAIITEFLSLAKNKRLDFAPATLNGIIASLFPLLQADAIREGKEIILDLGETPSIMVDSNEIRQLILNLIRNGLDAMKPGGVITIAVASDSDGVVLSVRDAGEGIPPAIFENLGAPFLTTKENGTGLGLTVCYKIVERHNGIIEVKTGLQGTTFAVRFPLQLGSD
jgi:signal transduction histidine kinase